MKLEDVKIGQKYRFNSQLRTEWPYMKPAQTHYDGDIVEIDGVCRKMPIQTVSGGMIWDWTDIVMVRDFRDRAKNYVTIPVDWLEPIEAESAKCSCSIQSLMTRGCTCGSLKGA